MLGQQLVNALSLGCVYALFALGFTLVFGVLGVINLSHGAVFMLGAYAALQLVLHLSMPLWLAAAVACLVSGLAALCIELLILKPLRRRNAPHLIPMIATIGVAITINSAAQGFFGAETVRFPADAIPDDLFSIAGLHVTFAELLIIFSSFALMAFLIYILRKTSLGRSLRAIAESPRAASLLGINVERLFHLSAFTAGVLGGFAGVLISLYANAVYPLMGQPMLHKGIAVIILGGMGEMRGAMLAGLFLGFAEVLSVAYIGSDMRDAVAFGLLFLILLIRPQGLFGTVLERKA